MLVCSRPISVRFRCRTLSQKPNLGNLMSRPSEGETRRDSKNAYNNRLHGGSNSMDRNDIILFQASHPEAEATL
jgi:hypothetical protein